MKAIHYLAVSAIAAATLFSTPALSAQGILPDYKGIFPEYVVSKMQQDHSCVSVLEVGKRLDQACSPKDGIVMYADVDTNANVRVFIAGNASAIKLLEAEISGVIEVIEATAPPPEPEIP